MLTKIRIKLIEALPLVGGVVFEVLQDLVGVLLHVLSKLGHFAGLSIQAKINKAIIIVHLSRSGVLQGIDFFQLE